MGELGGTVEYLYWSTRRTSRFIEDNGLSVQPVTRTFTSPSFGWLPTFSRSKTSASGVRPQIAKEIEGALGQIAVSRFNAPGPIQYAKGTSVVVFSEFMHVSSQREDRPTVIFTVVDHSRRDRGSVAVCLFGSMDNFPSTYSRQAQGTQMRAGCRHRHLPSTTSSSHMARSTAGLARLPRKWPVMHFGSLTGRGFIFLLRSVILVL